MTERKVKEELAAIRDDRSRRRRARRGLVAGYIHELSERHNGGHPRPTLRAAEAIEPARGC